MTRPSRMEIEVRHLLETRPAPIPTDLPLRAAALGDRLLRRHRAVRRWAWGLLIALVLALAVWAAVMEPWEVPPVRTTPPVDAW